MRISWTWLGEYVSLDGLEPESLAERLTLLGLEVEGVEHTTGGLDGIVVARVEAVTKHPNADRLRLCDVDAGARGRFRIVCGAPNVEAGMCAPFALEGTVMPNGLEIRRVKIRGEESVGMLCSELELGLSAQASGLMALDATATPGTPLVEHLSAAAPERLSALHRAIIEISVTPNRGDCLSHIGVAREVAAAYGRTLRLPQPELPPGERPAASVPVAVEDGQGCPRYALTVLRGVAVKPSPAWLRRAVEAAGARSINNIVDVTNYVAFELGQPQHAFDLARLRGGRIEVRRARAGEQLEAINHQTYALTSDDLVIADGEGPVAIAGVMGGAGSEVGEKTVDIALECAYFDPSAVRRTAKRLGLHSESSHRFERGVDPNGVARATARAIELILRTLGADASKVTIEETVDVYPSPIERAPIVLRTARVNAMLGLSLDTARVRELIEALGIATEPVDGETDLLLARPPSHRFDLEREIDLVEEVARSHGLDQVEAVLPSGALGDVHRARTAAVDGMPRPPATLVTWRQLERESSLRQRLRDAGLHEAIHYAFVDPAQIEALGFESQDARRAPVRLKNPMSVEQSVMRTSLVPGLVAAVARNQAQQATSVALFELASVFWRTGEDAIETDAGVREPLMLGLVLQGERARHWSERSAVTWDAYDLKGLVEAVASELGVVFETGTASDAEAPFLHPGVRASVLYEGQSVGCFGELHPRVVSATPGLSGPVYVAELRLDDVLGLAVAARRVRSLPRFPSSARDVALLLDASVTFASIAAAVEAHRPALLADWRVFDVYAGAGIAAGKRSVALSLVYRDPSAADPERGRTLTDDEVNQAHAALVASLSEALGAARR